MSDYWKECIEESFEDAGISATKEQIDIIVNWAESAHENYGMAHGHEYIPNPMAAEVENIKRDMANLQRNHQIQLDGVRNGVANRRNVDITDVNIDDRGNVTYNI